LPEKPERWIVRTFLGKRLESRNLLSGELFAGVAGIPQLQRGVVVPSGVTGFKKHPPRVAPPLSSFLRPLPEEKR
jgi:hypothetical protein